jgi:DNA-binding XRE family transcriptional regulator
MSLIVKDLTPAHMRCTPIGPTCPAVHELSDGNLALIGKSPDAALLDEMDGLIGSDELAVVVDRALFANVPTAFGGDTSADGLSLRAGKRLRDYRHKLGLTLAEVGTKAGTTPQTIHRLETGGQSFTLGWVEKLAKALKVRPEFFVRGVGDD